jgi:hypothetical protein
MLAALGFVIGEQLEDFPAFMNFDGQVTGESHCCACGCGCSCRPGRQRRCLLM